MILSVLIFAGHDTTNLAVARILHTLSMHQEAQEMLRKEVTAARKEHGGDLDYDTLMGLPYLDSVCRETLRVYPPAPMVSRTCVICMRSNPNSDQSLSRCITGRRKI